MAGISRYERAKQMLTELKSERGAFVSLGTLRQAIIIKLGSDEKRTVLPYLRMMNDSGLIKETIHGWEILLKNKSEQEVK